MEPSLYKKIILVGPCSGKSSILLRYMDDQFKYDITKTIGVDFTVKTIEFNGSTIKMQIWDTTGQDRFREITRQYYPGANMVLLVFDITDYDSFLTIPNYFNDARNENSEAIIALVANKYDLETQRKVDDEQIENLRKELNISLYFRTSAKENIGINEMFNEITYTLISNENNKISK